MTVIDTEPTPTRPPRRRWPITIAAAAAVVAVVVGGLVLVARDDADDPQVPAAPNTTAAPGPPAEEQARGLAGAMLIWRYEDPDEAMRHLTDELIAEAADGTREGYRLEGRMLDALGEQSVNIRCGPAGESAAGIDVLCTYDSHTFRSEERGLAPFPEGVRTVTVRDDTIVAFGEFDRPPFGAEEHFSQMWDEFKQWVTAKHPDDLAVMYEGSGWRLTEESIALWERRTIEWAEEQLEARVGFIGLPPEGATPTTPVTGDLVVRWGGPHERRFWVYDDGRVIWLYQGYVAEGANADFTGFLEQRLTPEGVDLIRSEFAASGDERLADLESWLPASAWEDQTIRAYVPSGYGICLFRSDPNELGPISTLDVESTQPDPGQLIEQLLNLLPAPVADVLRDSETVPDELGEIGDDRNCLAVTTDEARLLDQALTDAGAEPLDDPFHLDYHLDYPGQDGAGVNVLFEPQLPDGSITCSGCG